MFLSEFDCCHKTVQLLKWWNSLHCALFSCCCLLCACSNKKSLPTVRNLLGSEMVDTHRNPSPKGKRSKHTKARPQIFFEIIFFHSSSSEEVIFPHRYSETAHSKRTQRFCGLFGASYISCTSESEGSWSATEKQQKDFGFGMVRFIFYLKLALLQ